MLSIDPQSVEEIIERKFEDAKVLEVRSEPRRDPDVEMRSLIELLCFVEMMFRDLYVIVSRVIGIRIADSLGS